MNFYHVQHFKGTRAMTRRHGRNRLCRLHEVSSLPLKHKEFLESHPPVNVVPQKEVIAIRREPECVKMSDQIHKLAVDVAHDVDWCL